MCVSGAVGLGEAEALLDNFRKLSHLPAKLKRGQKGRIKIGSLPCPEPLHTHTVFMQSGPVWRELVLLAVEMWSTSGGQLSGQSVEPTFPSVEQRTTRLRRTERFGALTTAGHPNPKIAICSFNPNQGYSIYHF